MTQSKEEMRVVKYRGTIVEMGGERYTIAPLTFKMLQEHEDDIKAVSALAAGNMKVNDMQAALPIILAAVKRNYEDMTAERLGDILDMGNVREAFGAALGMSEEQIETVRRRTLDFLPGEARPTPRVQ